MRKISDSTINLYEKNLERLQKKGFDYKNVKDANEFVTSLLQEERMGEGNVKNYLCSIVWYYRNNNIDENINVFIDKINEISKNISEKYDTNLMTEKEIECYLEWEEILKIFQILYKNRNNSQTAFKKCIAVSVYVLFPPRRIKDYSDMIAIKNRIDIIDDKKNYYISSDKKFVFASYKTASNYGTKEFDVPQELCDLLNEYINKYDLLNKEIIGLGESELSKKIKNIFTSMSGKGATVTTLRHSYINHMSKNGFLDSTYNKKELASKMAHNHATQQDLYRKIIVKE
jgi:hypothetical protein